MKMVESNILELIEFIEVSFSITKFASILISWIKKFFIALYLHNYNI